MAHISYRVSGKKDGKPATRRFPDSREGRKERDSFAETLADPRVVIDVRIRIGGREVSRTFTRRKDADSYAATKEVDKLRGLFIDPRERRVTVEAVAARWLESNPGKRPNTLVSDDLALRLYIVPRMGSRGIGEVVPADVQALVNGWSKRLAPRTVRRHYGVLRALFAYATENDWIARSPCRKIKLPRVTKTRMHKLEPSKIEEIAHAMPVQHQPIVWLGATLGLRWSEIVGLRVGRLDLLHKSLTVAEAITRAEKGRLVSGEPKSRAGKRTLPLPEALKEILAAHLARRVLTAIDADALVFADSEGGPLSYSNWRRRVWLPACRAADCEGAGFHDLRRATGTGLVADGVDVKTAQKILGHADVRMTLELYAQGEDAADRMAAEKLGNRFHARDGRGMTFGADMRPSDPKAV